MRRSQLFVPANEEKKIRKSTSLDADSIIFDLEDAVPWSGKSRARDGLGTIMKELSWDSKRELCVRINKKQNGEYSQEDIDAVSKMEKINSIVLPKLEDDSTNITGQSGKNVIGLVETARGLSKIEDIARSTGIVALAFGPQDYSNSVRGSVSAYTSNVAVLTMIVSAARSYDIDPIDGVYFDLDNLDGFRKVATAAKNLGCSGKQVVHPSQIEIANSVFSPSLEEILEATEIIKLYEAAEKNNTGAIRMDGRLIDAVHYRRAKDLVARMQ